MKLYEWTLRQTRDAIRTGQVTAEEITRLFISRIEQHNPSLRAYITVADNAIEAARVQDARLRSGEPVGPLCGVPIAVKDLFDTDFLPTTYGTKGRENVVPSATAAAVQRLQSAGAVIIGKTNLHEYAYGTTSENPHFGNCVNPWNRAKIAGGSSGGSSVAIVAGLCTAALGTDTGGSVRIPAALTGHVGLKPSYGRVPTAGVYPLAPSLDHVGPMTRTIDDAALMFEVLSTPEHRLVASSWTKDPITSDSPPHIRVGVPRRFFFDKCHPSVLQTIQEALNRIERSCPEVVFEEVTVPLVDEVPEVQNATIGSEARAIHESNLRAHPERYGTDVRQRLQAADSIRGWEYVRAQSVRAQFRLEAGHLLEQVDVIVTPTTPLTATDIGQAKAHIRTLEVGVRAHLTRCTNPWNLAGFPALTMPCGLTPDGLPVGLQVVAGPMQDERLLQIAQRFEEVLEWTSLAPEFR